MPDHIEQAQRLLAQLRFPCGDAPLSGELKQVAPGIHWLRMPLPFQLNHINLYLLEEVDGWTIVDCGMQLDETKGRRRRRRTGACQQLGQRRGHLSVVRRRWR